MIQRALKATEKQEIDDGFDEAKEIYLFSELLARVQLYKQLGYNTYLKLLRLSLLGGQPCRLTNSFVEYYRFDSLMSQLFKSLGYKTYLKLLRLPLLGGQPCRLTNSFVEYYRFDSLMSQLFRSLEYNTYLKLLNLKTAKILHNLSYVTLFFVICFTDGIFDAFNCWNHCIFQILCIRHWHIFSCTTTDWCIQIVKCF